jgi:chemotaxis protein methyltransferase CheR
MTQTSPRETNPPSELTLKPGQFEKMRDILAQYSGVYLDQTSQRVLATGLAQRLAIHAMTFDAYVQYIRGPSGQTELQQLSELVLNHETVFFRNQPHMRALRDIILPQIHRRKPPGEPLRIWSAGCSTGEEPYSLAIMALESLGRRLTRPLDIWGTDLSEAALEKARRGAYRGRTLSNVNQELLAKYFDYRGGLWSVNQQVRDIVHFDQLNLLQPFPAHVRGIDIIFCQNVTIYFELATFRTLVDRFYHVLPDGGYLFLGFSETLWNIYDKFRLQEMNNAFVYVKEKPQLQPQPQSATAQPRQPLPAKPGTPPRPSTSYPPASGRIPSASQHPSRRPLSDGSTSSAAAASRESTLKRGRELLDAGQVDEVLDMLYKVPLNGPHAPKTLALIAQAHANRGDLDVAVAEARRAIELNSLTTEAYSLLGVLYARQGQFQAAAYQLERARYLDPDSALVSFHLAEVYRQLERRDAAIREYRNTLHKLAVYSPDALLEGVGVGLLRETCERYVQMLR